MAEPPNQPILARERIHAIDAVRGLALLGVLQINLFFFSGHIYREWAGLAVDAGWGGSVPVWILNHLVSGKAIFCFSMLFGIGLCIQMDRFRAKGIFFGGFVFRRLAALALLGTIHVALLWNGDILFTYALIGLLVSPLLWARPKTLVIFTGLACVASVFRKVVVDFLHAPNWFYFSYWRKQADWLLQSSNQAYGHGTWIEAARWRWWEWNHLGRSITVITVFDVLPLFLIGIFLWRSGLIQNATDRAKTIRALFHVTFWPGLIICSLPFDLSKILPEIWFTGWHMDLIRAIWTTASICLALSYFLGSLLLLQVKFGRRIITWIAPMGRMALTNYVIQSLVCTWVFNSHGLGLWGQVSQSNCILGGLTFYCLQTLFSHWWLSRFQFGPIEWIWRTMTYWKLQPFSIRAQLATDPLN